MKFVILIILISISKIVLSYEIQEKDLSIVLDASLNKKIEMKEPLFSKKWFHQITEKQFRKTDVGYALEEESPLVDWRLISIRIAPCVSLVLSYYFNPETFCWPQVRTVWAPVFDRFRTTWGISVENYSDDRAIHALYFVADKSTLENKIYQKIKKLTESAPEKLKSISTSERELWLKLRRKTIATLLKDVLSIRTENSPDEKFKGFGIRPEIYNDNNNFRDRLYSFLLTYTKREQISELTAFSLPEGRDAAGIDTWVFVAFTGKDGNITAKRLNIFDRNTGKKLNEGTYSQTTTMNSDDPSLYTRDTERLRNQVLLFNEDREKIRKKVFSKQSLLPGETSCVTCHKFNKLKFNFHNLSKFEDRSTTISEKLKYEVKKDLIWLKQNSTR